MWGPAYRGFWGKSRKALEIIRQPWHMPWFVGMVGAAAILGSIPVSEEEVKNSKFTNREAIMEEKKAKTGHYH